MNDEELRKILHEVMEEIEESRSRVGGSRFGFLRKALIPGMIAASLGLAGCDGRGIGSNDDAGLDDAAISMDVGAGMDVEVDRTTMDSEVLPPYMAPPYDAEIDAGPQPVYKSP